MKEWNFKRDFCPEFIVTIGRGVRHSDIKLFFDFDVRGWNNGKEIFSHYQHLENCSKMEELVVELGIEESKTQARKKGYVEIIPEGYSEFKRGHRSFYILKKTKRIDYE